MTSALVFAVGPLTGSPVRGTGRGQLAAISPQTGFFADLNFGGHLASALKGTGATIVRPGLEEAALAT